MQYQYVENQQYLAQVVDQGFTYTKNGDLIFKTIVRLVGKVTDFVDPTNGPDPVPGAPEVDVRFNLYGNPDHIEFRLRDLASLGFTGDDVAELDPNRGEGNYHSFVGQKVIVTPKWSAGADHETTRPFWNIKALSARAKRKFLNDVPAAALEAKAAGLNELMSRARKKGSGPAAGAPQGDLVGAGAGDDSPF